MFVAAGPKTSSEACNGVCCAASDHCTYDYGSKPNTNFLCCETSCPFPSAFTARPSQTYADAQAYGL